MSMDHEMTARQRRVMAFFAAMCAEGERLTPEERADLEAWERENLGRGNLGTSDWPGWARRGLVRPPWWDRPTASGTSEA